MSVSPNCQLVRSMESLTLSCLGRRLKISLATKSESRLKLAIKRWIRLREEPAWAVVLKALASFSNVTVCTLHSAVIKCAMSFTLAKFIFPLKCVLRTELNSVFLIQTLVFFIRKMSDIILLIY